MQATVEYDLALQPFKRPQDEEYLKVNGDIEHSNKEIHLFS